MRKTINFKWLLTFVLVIGLMFSVSGAVITTFADETETAPTENVIIEASTDTVTISGNPNGVTTEGVFYETFGKNSWSGTSYKLASGHNWSEEYREKHLDGKSTVAAVTCFKSPVKAEYFETFNISFYSAVKTDFYFFASTQKDFTKDTAKGKINITKSGVVTVSLYVSDFANESGYIDNVTMVVFDLPATGTQVFFGEYEFVLKPPAPTENVVIEASTDTVTIGNANTNGVTTANVSYGEFSKNNWTGTSYKLASSKHWNSLNFGENAVAAVVCFATPVKAEYFDVINVSFFSGIKAEFYFFASTQKELTKETAKGKTEAKSGDITISLTASDFADERGYINNITMVAFDLPETTSQVFIGTYEFVLKPTENIVIEASDDTVTIKAETNVNNVTTANIFYDGFWTDSKTKPAGFIKASNNIWNSALASGKTAIAAVACFKTPVKAEYFGAIKMSFYSGLATDFYVFASTQKDLTKEVAMAKVTATQYSVVTVTLNAADFADENEYISNITIAAFDLPENGGQIYLGKYEFILKGNRSVTVNDGENVNTLEYEVGTKVSLASLGVENTADEVVVGYTINGKTYSGNYSFIITENTEISVVRAAFKMRIGASIRKTGVSGLKFIADLNVEDYNSLTNLFGEGKVSLAIGITRLANNKTVEKKADNLYDEDGYITYSGVVVGIPEESYTEQFSARAYMEITFEDGTYRVYAIENDNVRSIYDVANNALLSGKLSEGDKALFENIKNIVEGV